MSPTFRVSAATSGIARLPAACIAPSIAMTSNPAMSHCDAITSAACAGMTPTCASALASAASNSSMRASREASLKISRIASVVKSELRTPAARSVVEEDGLAFALQHHVPLQLARADRLGYQRLAPYRGDGGEYGIARI